MAEHALHIESLRSEGSVVDAAKQKRNWTLYAGYGVCGSLDDWLCINPECYSDLLSCVSSRGDTPLQHALVDMKAQMHFSAKYAYNTNSRLAIMWYVDSQNALYCVSLFSGLAEMRRASVVTPHAAWTLIQLHIPKGYSRSFHWHGW